VNPEVPERWLGGAGLGVVAKGCGGGRAGGHGGGLLGHREEMPDGVAWGRRKERAVRAR